MSHSSLKLAVHLALATSLLVAAPRLMAADATDTTTTTAGTKRSLTALEEVTVEAQRTSEGVARQAEFTAPNFVNLTTAEVIRRLPDVNAGEAVARIPGISLETDTGEGRFINIRGLDADLNATTFGGQRMPPSSPASPFSGGRAVAFDSIPIGFVGAVLVTKTLLPEQDAEALGGTIDITPKTVPMNGKPFGELRLGTGLQVLRHTSIVDVAGTVGTRFGGDNTYQPFSILASGAFYSDRRGIDDVEPSYWNADNGATTGVPNKAFDDIQQRYYRYHRDRRAFGGELGYDPDASNHFYARYFNTGYTETVNRQILDIQPTVVDGDGNLTLAKSATDPNGYTDTFTSAKTNRWEQETLNVQMTAVGGKNEFGDNTLDYQLGYAEGTYDKPFDYNATWSTDASGTLAYNNTTAKLPGDWSFSGYNPTDPHNYTLTRIYNYTGHNDDKEWSGKINLVLATHWTGADKESLKIGASARLRTRTQTASAFRADPTAIGNLNLSLADASDAGNVSFYDNRYQNGPNVDASKVIGIYNSSSPSGNPRYATADGFEPSYYQKDKEDVYAAYGQYAWNNGPLGLVGGLRVEHTSATYEGNQFAPTRPPSNITPVSASHSYTNLFPSAQARYELDKDLILRAAVSTSIARPGFNQINANAQIDPTGPSVTTGNPDLKPAQALSFDVAIEKSMPHAGVASFGLFDKEIRDYIVPLSTKGAFNSAPSFGLPAGTVFSVNSFANSDRSYARGFELNYVQRLKDLVEGPLGGFGVALNYTYVNSQVTIKSPDGSVSNSSSYTSTLPSTARDTANATLMYESKQLELTLGAMYVGQNLFGYNGGPATNIYSSRRLSMDFGGQYHINDTVTAYVNVKNLLNTPLEFTYGQTGGLVIQREFYKATYLAGVNLSF